MSNTPGSPDGGPAPARLGAAVLAVLGWASLAGSVLLNLASRDGPVTCLAVVREIWWLLRYFTILTNILMAAAMTRAAWAAGDRGGPWLAGVALQAAMLSLLYHFVLGGSHGPWSWRLVIDLAHHYVLPIAVVLFWLRYGARRRIGPAAPLLWLVYPVAYFLYMLARGHLSGRYPYAFLSPAVQGLSRMVTASALIVAAFLVVGYAVAAVTWWRGGRPAATGPGTGGGGTSPGGESRG